MGREGKGQLFGYGFVVLRLDSVAGRAIDFLVMMDENTVVQDGDISRLFEPAGFEDGGEEDNIKRLPLAGPSAGIYHRRGLAVNGGGLAVGIELLGV